MGMYTELVCAFELESDTPKEVIQILRHMTGQEKELGMDESELPSHPLFGTERWRFMLQSDSYYFPGDTHSRLKIDNLYPTKPMYYLTIRCNLKNYDNEIDNLLSWLGRYTRTTGFIGYKRYEEAEEPTLLYI